MSRSGRTYWSGKNNKRRFNLPKLPNYAHCSELNCQEDIFFVYVPEITTKGWSYLIDNNVHWFCPKHPRNKKDNKNV